MISAELKGLYSLEIDSLEHYYPENPEDFCISVRFIAGPRGEAGEESFDLRMYAKGTFQGR